MEHVEYTHTAGMDRDAVEERLRDAETGVLALADGDDAYAVPLAFHYDGGDVIVLRLGRDGDSEKIAYIESTGRACFVVHEYGSPRDSWSVLLRGELHAIPRSDDRYDDAEINRTFPDLRVFDEDIDDLAVELYEFRMDAVTGRETVD